MGCYQNVSLLLSLRSFANWVPASVFWPDGEVVSPQWMAFICHNEQNFPLVPPNPSPLTCYQSMSGLRLAQVDTTQKCSSRVLQSYPCPETNPVIPGTTVCSPLNSSRRHSYYAAKAHRSLFYATIKVTPTPAFKEKGPGIAATWFVTLKERGVENRRVKVDKRKQ
jgi:hypothetical protein